MEDPLELISIDPAVCCVKGTGLDTTEILRHYPTLTADGVRAAIAYGAWLVMQEIRPLSPTR